MEDFHYVSGDFSIVVDGHGGQDCAREVAKEFEERVAAFKTGKRQKAADMKSFFEETFKHIAEKTDKFSGQGACALAVHVGEEEITLANLGDCRAVICRGGKAVALTEDHLPKGDERKRILDLGGAITYASLCERVYKEDEKGDCIYGLAMTRAFGDTEARPFVIPEPTITVEKRTPEDEFILSATDGIWNALKNQKAVEYPDVESLKNAAFSGWGDMFMAADNITVVRIPLQKS